MNNNFTACPICDYQLSPPSDAQISELISCPDCGCQLEITSLNPFTVSEAPQEEEDWGE
jgi:alpha-aminoadipate carrier protein LysW